MDLRLRPFDLAVTARHRGVADPGTAFRLHAPLGGSPGYRNLSPLAPPRDLAEFDDWVASTVLNPGQALYSRSEAEYLSREDPRFTGSALHYAIINAVATGATSPARIGALLERDRTALARPLAALVEAGFLDQASDPLWKRRPVITLTDPIIRFHNLITVPYRDLVETGAAETAWRQSRATFGSRILGPHFEECAREWLRRYEDPGLLGRARSVTASVVNDGDGRARHEIFAAEGFQPDLVETARRRDDVLLVDLPTLFGYTAPEVTPRRAGP